MKGKKRIKVLGDRTIEEIKKGALYLIKRKIFWTNTVRKENG